MASIEELLLEDIRFSDKSEDENDQRPSNTPAGPDLSPLLRSIDVDRQEHARIEDKVGDSEKWDAEFGHCFPEDNHQFLILQFLIFNFTFF